eukprot:939529-Karenia_brevis.AAC.1
MRMTGQIAGLRNGVATADMLAFVALITSKIDDVGIPASSMPDVFANGIGGTTRSPAASKASSRAFCA